MYQPTFFEQSLRNAPSYGSFRQRNKDANPETKKTTVTPSLSRRNSFDNRASILRRSFRRNVSDAKEKKIEKTPSTSKKNSRENLKPPIKDNSQKNTKIFRSKSLDFVKMSSLNDLSRTISCSSFFASKTDDDFLKNFLKNMSILKAGLLKTPKHPAKITCEKDSDTISLKSESISSETTSVIGSRLHQKTTRSSLARNHEGFGEVSFEKSLRSSSKRISAQSPSSRIGCPKENAIAQPKPQRPNRQRRRDLRKLINDGFLEKLKSRSELRLDFVKEKPSFHRVDGVVSKENAKSPQTQLVPKRKCGDPSLSELSKNKCKSPLPNCDSKNQKSPPSKNVKSKLLKNSTISFDEVLERSLHRKYDLSTVKDSYFKTLDSLLRRNINDEVVLHAYFHIAVVNVLFLFHFRLKPTNK